VIINGLNPKMVVEVGCGLGGILSRVRAHYRWGLDIDSAAIAAARFIHGRSARFLIGSFEQLPDGEIDVLLAVNWLHDFPPEQVERWIAPLLPRVGSIIVDSVVTGTPGYRYHHRFGFLDKMGEVAWFDAAGEPHRKFLLWKSRAE
jgi:hypothetical protein